MTNKKTIEIYKMPKTGFFKSLVGHTLKYSLLIFVFYFNYKFIDGNNFLDFIIFMITVMIFIGYAYRLEHNIIKYNNVSDDKIKAIEELLSNN